MFLVRRVDFAAHNSDILRKLILFTLASYPFLTTDSRWAEIYAPNGSLLLENDTCYRKDYAKTLSTIAEQGPDAFYTGPIAENVTAAAQARGGILQMSDLANYSAILRTPSNITYRDRYRIFSTIAPSSGSVVLSALKIFEGYSGGAEPDDPAINLTTHRLIEVGVLFPGNKSSILTVGTSL